MLKGFWWGVFPYITHGPNNSGCYTYCAVSKGKLVSCEIVLYQ